MASKKRIAGYNPVSNYHVPDVPARVVEALVEVLGVDKREITKDALLEDDLGADDMDIVEIADRLGCEDECLDWLLVSDIVQLEARRA